MSKTTLETNFKELVKEAMCIIKNALQDQSTLLLNKIATNDNLILELKQFSNCITAKIFNTHTRKIETGLIANILYDCDIIQLAIMIEKKDFKKNVTISNENYPKSIDIIHLPKDIKVHHMEGRGPYVLLNSDEYPTLNITTLLNINNQVWQISAFDKSSNSPYVGVLLKLIKPKRRSK